MKSIVLVLALIAVGNAAICGGCWGTSAGVCKSSKYGVCYELDVNTGNCPPGSDPCEAQTYYACKNETCEIDNNGHYTSSAECTGECSIQCVGCNSDSKGQCQDTKNGVCHELDDDKCPDGSTLCSGDVTLYSCINQTCAINAGGKWTTKGACDTECAIECVDCKSGGHGQCKNEYGACYEYAGNECPQGSTVCAAGTTKYACNLGACTASSVGTFSSMTDCEAGCSSGTQHFTCNSGTCETSSTGTYASEADCKAVCTSSGGGACTGCNDNGSGDCKNPHNDVCYNSQEFGGSCPAGTNKCSRGNSFLN